MTVAESAETIFPRHTLANGLQIVAQPMNGVESVAMGFMLDAGGRHTKPEQAGIAHFVESLAYQGTTSRNVQQLTEAFEDIGARTSSGVDSEFASFSTSLLSRNLDPALELLSDVVLHPAYASDEVDKARDRILQEIAQLEDEPMRKVLDLLRRQYFAGHPLGCDVNGTVESVNGLSRDDITTYFAGNYTAANTVFAIAGRFDFDHVVQHMERLCSGWSAGTSKTNESAPAPTRRVLIVPKESMQQHIGIAFPGVSTGHPDYYAMALLVTTLGGSMNSRLFLEVREKRSLAYGISASTSTVRGGSYVRIYAGTTPDKADQTVTVVLDELAKLEADGVTADELRRAKILLKSNVIMRSESSTVRRGAIATAWWYERHIRTLQEIDELISRVTLDDVKRIAGSLGMTKDVVLTAIGPRTEQELTGGRI